MYASAPYTQHSQPPPQLHPQSIQLSPSNPQQQQQPHPGYTPPYTSTPPSAAPSANYSTNNNSTSTGQTNNSSGSGSSHDTRNINTNTTTSVNAPVTTSYPPMPSPRIAYTRTLVGPLSANACRLQDEHRKPGIFFLFQDLSVRTEGKVLFCSFVRFCFVCFWIRIFFYFAARMCVDDLFICH